MSIIEIIQVVLIVGMCVLVVLRKYYFSAAVLVAIWGLGIYEILFNDFAEASIVIAIFALFTFLILLTLRIFGVAAFWIGIIVMLVGLFMPASFMMFPFGILFFASLFYGVITYRSALLSDILSTISTCLTLDMPLSTGFAQAAKNSNTSSAKVLYKMSGWLSQGFTLSEAMKRSYRGFPGHVISMVEMAEKVDQLPKAAEYLKYFTEESSINNKSMRIGYDIFAYPFIIVMMVTAAMFFQFTFIVPKFKTIFADMDSELPPVTLGLLDFGRIAFNSPVGLILLLTPVFILFIYFRKVFFERRPDLPSIFSNIGDTMKWFIPGWRWFEKVLSHIRVISYLRLAMAADISMDKAIENCAGLDVNIYFRRQLKKWHALVVSGVPIASAAAMAGMFRSLVWCFDTEVGPDNPPEALELIEHNMTSNYRFRCNMFREIMGPVMVVVCSVIVGLFCYGIFTPLVKMITMVMSVM